MLKRKSISEVPKISAKIEILRSNDLYLEGHFGSVTCIAFCNTGPNFFTGSSDSTVRFWSILTRVQLYVFYGHKYQISSIAVTKSDSHIISCSESPEYTNDHTIRIWNITSKALESVLSGHSKRIISLCITENQNLIVSGSADTHIKLWSLPKPSLLYTFQGHTSKINAVASYKSFILSASDDCTVKLWNTASLSLEKTLSREREPVSCLVVSTNYAVWSVNLIAKVWDLQNSREIGVFQGHEYCITSLVATRNYIVSLSRESKAIIWDCSRLNTVKTHVFKSGCISIAASQDEGFIVTGYNYDADLMKICGFWDSDTALEFFAHIFEVTCMALSKDNAILVSGSRDCQVIVWDFLAKTGIVKLHGHSFTVSCVAISRDNRFVIAGSYDHTVRLWDLQTMQEAIVLAEHCAVVTCVEFTLCNSFAFSAARDHSLRISDLHKERKRVLLQKKSSNITSMILCRSGRYLICGDSEKSLMVFKVSLLKFGFV